ncbi:MAG: formyltetrahydrofolate deformylase [Gammaproteobacteria bacterium]|nr:formyltetrahydrofolate deformylase [Gammaproteobacteria bacterium]
MRRYILTLSCPDRPGVVAAVSGLIAQHQGWITEAAQHSDDVEGWFFMRVEIQADSLNRDLDAFRGEFAPLAEQFAMRWAISDTARKKRLLVLVSQHDHCLADLLYRWRTQDFEFDIPCVISNHEGLRDYVEWHGIPYVHLPIETGNKAEVFARIEGLYQEHQGDAMVLARYMQILPDELCRRLAGRIINIHHSFLPSFVGAKPYHQAFDRGVKLIGATCHYVSGELDAGPIIEQDVERVDHSHGIEDLVRLGRDIERRVLARGLAAHCQDRVLLHKNKTVVFN